MRPKLLLQNLPLSFSRTQVAKWLSSSAVPSRVTVLTHEKTDRSLGQAVAEFPTVIEAGRVLDFLDNAEQQGQKVKISWYDDSILTS